MMLTIAKRTRINARMAMAAASARGILRRSRKSTAGSRRSCRSNDRKMMNARSGKNQNVESSRVKVTPRMIDVR